MAIATKSTTIAPQRRPLQVPLMYAFRDAFRAHDSAAASVEHTAENERVLTDRGAMRRRGANEAQLRANLDLDLSNLVNTVNLESCVDLGGVERVRASILNFGMEDLSYLTSDSVNRHRVVEALREALLRHEPRLIPSSVKVTLRDGYDAINQRIGFSVEAEMACRPVDVPLEFVAELDVGLGKVHLSKAVASG